MHRFNNVFNLKNYVIKLKSDTPAGAGPRSSQKSHAGMHVENSKSGKTRQSVQSGMDNDPGHPAGHPDLQGHDSLDIWTSCCWTSKTSGHATVSDKHMPDCITLPGNNTVVP